ncbi:MAG TPA: amidohydrolase family protein [Candidatus Acidoferrales bacterium]|jgi:aminocarboxymuconate-semialdehyde decarboxylase|nr:amidohydrolase family protein [Candidatus Acidoferrales bacterium]
MPNDESKYVRPVDVHAHFFPQAYLDVLAEYGPKFGVEYRAAEEGFYIKTEVRFQGPLPYRSVDLKLRIADMDAQGTAMQAMSLTGPMAHWGDEEVSHKLASAYNDAASAANVQYPTRLFGLLTLPMMFPDRAIDELNRASKLPGLRGVYMGTNINNRDLDDPLFEPILARIEALDLPIFLHPLQVAGGPRIAPFSLVNLIGFPLDTTIAVCHLIFGGVLDRHPKLRFVLPHGGGVLLMLLGRMDHGSIVRPEIQKLRLPRPPSKYLDRFMYDTIVHSKSVMEFVISEVGADRIMVGSDYCLDMGYDQPLQVLDRVNMTPAQKRMILGENAARLLKL